MWHECNIAATRCGMLLQTHIRASADYLTFHADEQATCTYFLAFSQNRICSLLFSYKFPDILKAKSTYDYNFNKKNIATSTF